MEGYAAPAMVDTIADRLHQDDAPYTAMDSAHDSMIRRMAIIAGVSLAVIILIQKVFVTP